MALWSEFAHEEAVGRAAGQLRYQLLLIPEAPALLALLLIGWAYGFPPAVGILAAIVVAVFIVRLFLMTTAAAQLERARYRGADRFARAALGLYPWSADALALRAHGLSLRGDDAEAELLLRRAAKLAPDSDVIHSALAGSLLARGAFAEGRLHATQASRLAAGSPHATRHLAWLALHVDHDPVRAQRLLGTTDLDQLPPDLAAPLWVMFAEAQVARGATEAARITLYRIEGMLGACSVPQQAELYYYLGQLHRSCGDDPGPYFRRSVALDPQGRYAHAAWRAAIK